MSNDQSKFLLIERQSSALPDNGIENKDFQSSDFWEFCDNCGHKLVARKCEFVCPACGFFHSCSEP